MIGKRQWVIHYWLIRNPCQRMLKNTDKLSDPLLSEKKSSTKYGEKGIDKLSDMLLPEKKSLTKKYEKGTDELEDTLMQNKFYLQCVLCVWYTYHFLAIHIEDLLSKTIKGASSGTIYVSLLKKS